MAQQPKPWYRIENASAQAADVHILDEISPWGVTAADFIADVRGIQSARVNLHLNTPGGDVFDGIAIFNAIKDHGAEWHAFIPGLCASIGTVIAMGCSRIVIAPHARMMIHEAWGGALGHAEDMAKMAERLEATSQNIASIYAERAGGDPDEWRALMKAETWYTDQQAVDAGLADEVGRSNDVAAGKQAALFDLTRFRHGEREAASLRAVFASQPADAPAEEPAPEVTTEHRETTEDGEQPSAADSWLIATAARLADEREELDALINSVEMVTRS